MGKWNEQIPKSLSKLILETKMSWTKCLPLALLRLRTQPRRDIRLSAYELLYGVGFTPGEICMNALSSRDRIIRHYVHKLSQYLDHCRKHGLLAQTPPLEFLVHKIQIGDWVLIRCWKEEKLQPKWEGPFQMLLTSETAVRTKEKGWTHYTRIKGPVTEPKDQWTCVPQMDPLKVTLKRKNIHAGE